MYIPGEIFEVYVVHGDNGDERSSDLGPIIGVFSSSFNAGEHAVGKGYWGGKGEVKNRKAIVGKDTKIYLIDNFPVDLDGYQKDKDTKLKLETLASLTDEQKRVLGL